MDIKKVLILNPCVNTRGGGEKYMGYFCQSLEQRYEAVTIDILVYNYNGSNINQSTYGDVEDLNHKFGLTLERTYLKKIPGNYGENVLKNIIMDFNIYRISKDYDLFINWNFLSKQIGGAQKNLYFCMFPPKQYVYSQCKFIMRPWRKWLDYLFIESYSQYICISKFTQEWLLNYWPRIKKEKCELVYPPVYSRAKQINEITKKNIIVSVGRFFVGGHNKKQDRLLEFFLKYQKELEDYEYHIVGSVSDSVVDQEYLRKIEGMAKLSGKVILHINCSFQELIELYKNAKIFWHATGFGVDEKLHPEQMEHFGITTVEAMSYGAVPVVINKGGQKEIVKQGKNGFLWNDFEECLKFTRKAIEDEEMFQQISENAKKTAEEFSIEMFQKNIERCFEKIVEE